MDKLAPPHSTYPVSSHPTLPVNPPHEPGVVQTAASDEFTAATALDFLETAIDDWLGLDAEPERLISVHSALHGVVSAPYLLLDHSSMTPELVQALPPEVWKAFAHLALEQGCPITSVCFPQGMTELPHGLSQLGSLEFIGMPFYGGRSMDLRSVPMDSAIHLSLQGSSKSLTVRMRGKARMQITGHENTVTLHCYDESWALKKTKYLAPAPAPAECMEDQPFPALADVLSGTSTALPTTLPKADMLWPVMTSPMVDDIPIRKLLYPFQKILTTPLQEQKKIDITNKAQSAALAEIVRAVLSQDSELVKTCFDFFCLPGISDDFKFSVFDFILKNVSKQLKYSHVELDYLKIAPFVTRHFLESKIQQRMKLQILHKVSRHDSLGLFHALRKGDHHSLGLIMATLLDSALSTGEILGFVRFEKMNNPFLAAVENGRTESVMTFAQSVLSFPELRPCIRQIFQHSRPVCLWNESDSSEIEAMNIARTAISFAIVVLQSDIEPDDIDFLLEPAKEGLKNNQCVVGSINQPFSLLIHTLDKQLMRRYIATVFESRIAYSQKLKLFVHANISDDARPLSRVAKARYLKGWSMLMREIFFSALPSKMKFDIITLSEKSFGAGPKYDELFCQATDFSKGTFNDELSEMRKVICLQLRLPKNLEYLTGASLDKAVATIKGELDLLTLEPEKINLFAPLFRQGLGLANTCVAFTSLILESNLDDDKKVSLFEQPEEDCSGMPVHLHCFEELVKAYLDTVLTSSISVSHKVELLNQTKWVTNRTHYSTAVLFARRILKSSLDNEDLEKIFLKQCRHATVYNFEAGLSFLGAVLESRLPSEQKCCIAAGGLTGECTGIRQISDKSLIRNYLNLILSSGMNEHQKFTLCEARDSLGASYLFHLCVNIVRSNIAEKSGTDDFRAQEIAKLKIFMETIVASNIGDEEKTTLLLAHNGEGDFGIDLLVGAGERKVVSMINSIVLNSNLPESSRQLLYRNNRCYTQ